MQEKTDLSMDQVVSAWETNRAALMAERGRLAQEREELLSKIETRPNNNTGVVSFLKTIFHAYTVEGPGRSKLIKLDEAVNAIEDGLRVSTDQAYSQVALQAMSALPVNHPLRREHLFCKDSLNMIEETVRIVRKASDDHADAAENREMAAFGPSEFSRTLSDLHSDAARSCLSNVRRSVESIDSVLNTNLSRYLPQKSREMDEPDFITNAMMVGGALRPMLTFTYISRAESLLTLAHQLENLASGFQDRLVNAFDKATDYTMKTDAATGNKIRPIIEEHKRLRVRKGPAHSYSFESGPALTVIQ